MHKVCYCALLHMEGTPEDTKNKNAPVMRYNEIVVLRYYYPDDAETVTVSPSKQIWEVDFDRIIPLTRNGRFFAEYVFTDDIDRIGPYIEKMKQHAADLISGLKDSLIDMTYPFQKKTNAAGLEGFEFSSDIDIWQ